jgi:hypothetical protein
LISLYRQSNTGSHVVSPPSAPLGARRQQSQLQQSSSRQISTPYRTVSRAPVRRCPRACCYSTQRHTQNRFLPLGCTGQILLNSLVRDSRGPGRRLRQDQRPSFSTLRPPQAVAALHSLAATASQHIGRPSPSHPILSNTSLGHCQPSRPFKTPQAVHSRFWSAPHDPFRAISSTAATTRVPSSASKRLSPRSHRPHPLQPFASKAAHTLSRVPHNSEYDPDLDVIAAFTSCDYSSSSPYFY